MRPIKAKHKRRDNSIGNAWWRQDPWGSNRSHTHMFSVGGGNPDNVLGKTVLKTLDDEAEGFMARFNNKPDFFRADSSTLYEGRFYHIALETYREALAPTWVGADLVEEAPWWTITGAILPVLQSMTPQGFVFMDTEGEVFTPVAA